MADKKVLAGKAVAVLREFTVHTYAWRILQVILTYVHTYIV